MDTLGIEVADNWQVMAGAGTFFVALVALVVFAIMRDAEARKWQAKCKEGSERWREDSARWLANLATVNAEALMEREARRREAALVDKLLDRLGTPLIAAAVAQPRPEPEPDAAIPAWNPKVKRWMLNGSFISAARAAELGADFSPGTA